MSQDVTIGRKLKHFSASEVGFFEGPEKLLEVWFDLGCERIKGLRVLPRYGVLAFKDFDNYS